MDYTRVTIYTTSAAMDTLTSRLNDIGFCGFVVEDPADFEEFLAGAQTHWDYVDEKLMAKRTAEPNVKVFLSANAQGERQRETLLGLIDRLAAENGEGFYGRLALEYDAVRDEDWANNWKQYFKPLRVGERFLIKPSWEAVPADCAGLRVLEIDPGPAFGSGTHETTRLCIGMLEDAVKPGARVLDMGCGSGILAVAAMLCGADTVTGVDIDEAAVRTAGENLRRNGFDAYALYEGDVLSDKALERTLTERGPFDVIAANIVADVLIGMSPLFARLLAPSGTLIVSGIIGGRAQDVRSALEKAGFTVTRTASERDWQCFAAHRASETAC